MRYESFLHSSFNSLSPFISSHTTTPHEIEEGNVNIFLRRDYLAFSFHETNMFEVGELGGEEIWA